MGHSVMLVLIQSLPWWTPESVGPLWNKRVTYRSIRGGSCTDQGHYGVDHNVTLVTPSPVSTVTHQVVTGHNVTVGKVVHIVRRVLQGRPHPVGAKRFRYYRPAPDLDFCTPVP